MTEEKPEKIDWNKKEDLRRVEVEIVNPKTGEKTKEVYERIKPIPIYSGKCNHYYKKTGERDENTGLTPYTCQYCPKGISIRDDQSVKDGKLIEKE